MPLRPPGNLSGNVNGAFSMRAGERFTVLPAITLRVNSFGRGYPALRLTTLTRTSLIRLCHPGPDALK